MNFLKNKTFLNLTAVIVGNLIYAVSVKLFLEPSNLITGGTMGLALTANHLWGADINTFVLFFNVTMLLVGYFALGKAFALTTVASTFLTPGFMELWDRTMGTVVLTKDPMLNAIFFGIGIGVALGMVIRAGASTGGCDIPTILISRALRVPLGPVVYVWDICVLLLQLMFSNAEGILYGIFMAAIYTMVIDKVMMLGTERTEIKIVSEKAMEISDAIQKRVDRGSTLLHAEGGYLHRETKVVMSVVSNREVLRVEEIAHEIDPTCFMVINRVSQVRGRGFSLNKEYAEYID